MKAEELRIGNYVQDKKDREVLTLQVAHIGEGLINYWMESVYQSIPLTEEWLKRFGFTKNPVAWYKDISYFPKAEFKTLAVTLNQGVLIRCGDLKKWREDDDVISLLNTDVQGPIMVHQLQNLYFSLTGKEL